MYKIQEIRRLEDLDCIQDEWDRLLESTRDGSLFLSKEWLKTWLEVYWNGRPIRFLLARDENGLRGLAPLLVDSAGELWCSRSLTLAANSHSHTSTILGGQDKIEVLDAFLEHLARSRSHARMAFKHVVRSSSVATRLPEIAGQHRMCTVARDSTNWSLVRIDGDWEDYLKTRKVRVRRELRRKRKKLERAGQFEIRVVTTPEQCDDAMEQVFHVERKSWKEREGTSLTTEPGASEFYATLARLWAGRGWLRIYLLCLDGRPIAHIFGAQFRNAYTALKTSYDETYGVLSPGIVLFGHALQEAFEAKLDLFDFAGHESRWKQELATHSETHLNICAFSRTHVGCRACGFFHSVFKPTVKRLIPAQRKLEKA